MHPKNTKAAVVAAFKVYLVTPSGFKPETF